MSEAAGGRGAWVDRMRLKVWYGKKLLRVGGPAPRRWLSTQTSSGHCRPTSDGPGLDPSPRLMRDQIWLNVVKAHPSHRDRIAIVECRAFGENVLSETSGMYPYTQWHS